jgi:hypothetical protein
VRSHGMDESENIVGDIKALIHEYLRNPRCVILAIVPANVDFHNSQIMADALEVDPETKRTIPVITKPDLIDAGAEKDVEQLLLGRKTRDFQMGFHMVKGRGQAELDRNGTIEEGIRVEESFFSNTQPWRDVHDRDLFGTTNLRKKLGNLQLQMIREVLPCIILELHQKGEIAKEQLSQLGSIPSSDSEKRIFFRRLVDKIVDQLRGLLTGKCRVGTCAHFDEQGTFASKLHEECELFRTSVRKSKFSTMLSIEQGSNVRATLSNGNIVKGTVIEQTRSGVGLYIDCVDRHTTLGRELLLHKDVVLNEELEKGITWRDKGGLCISNGDGTFDVLKSVEAHRVRRDPDWILPRIKRNRTDDLPIFVNQDVFRAIVVDFIDTEWLMPCEQLVSATHTLLLNAMEQTLHNATELQHYLGLRDVLHRRMKDIIEMIATNARDAVKHFIKKERIPYTQDHYLQEILSKLKFESVFKQLGVALGLHNSLESQLTRRSIKTIVAAIAKQNEEKSMDEHMAEEMQNAVDAYGKVAMKRFIDGIPMECWSMFRTFPDEAEAIYFDDDDLRRHVKVRDDVSRKIKELEAENRELEAGLTILKSLY